MAFQSGRGAGHSQPTAEINMIPLIDVMLVLLVIFIVTAPLLTHAVKVDLPKVSSQPNDTRPEVVQIAVRADGTIFFNGKAQSREALISSLEAEGRRSPPPEVHLHADRHTAYEKLVDVMALSGKAGLTRIGFISEPATR